MASKVCWECHPGPSVPCLPAHNPCQTRGTASSHPVSLEPSMVSTRGNQAVMTPVEMPGLENWQERGCTSKAIDFAGVHIGCRDL